MPGFCSLKVGTLFEIHDLKKTEVTVSERQKNCNGIHTLVNLSHIHDQYARKITERLNIFITKNLKNKMANKHR